MPLYLPSSLFKYASHVINHSANQDTGHNPFVCPYMQASNQDISSFSSKTALYLTLTVPQWYKLDRFYLPVHEYEQRFLCILNMSPD
tara:strand:- start:509 stop:769 length:261 start_codon:yes stop_codon:yes gene_type:complete